MTFSKFSGGVWAFPSRPASPEPIAAGGDARLPAPRRPLLGGSAIARHSHRGSPLAPIPPGAGRPCCVEPTAHPSGAAVVSPDSKGVPGTSGLLSGTASTDAAHAPCWPSPVLSCGRRRPQDRTPGSGLPELCTDPPRHLSCRGPGRCAAPDAPVHAPSAGALPAVGPRLLPAASGRWAARGVHN